MLPHCIPIMRVYRTGSVLKRCFIAEPDPMFDFVCMSKVQVVMGDDFWHGVQHSRHTVFPFRR